ncbi:hypothetical protein GCM10010210_45610 [Pseudonocardia hydrocarbonoxydans]|uniref:Uncharacterized protein n=1 Tax=Pseudonocardia hydrocarbonoxydans TaxID=76726 RepID=A0A4Y3WVJ1_9PSEU|nr:hypothetical protein PHY01_48810 [Pseudonocardia hydrocarbonoxydans]
MFLGEDLGELLLGGLAAGGALDVVEGAQLGQHRVGSGELDLQVRSASPSPEDRHTVRPPRATERDRLPIIAPTARCVSFVVPDLSVQCVWSYVVDPWSVRVA